VNTSPQVPIHGIATLASGVAASFLASAALAQPAIRWSTIDSGGGRIASTDGTITLRSTIGQIDAGPRAGGSLLLKGGYWPGALPPAPPPPCPADFNSDGNLDPDDLADYIACFFDTPPCPAADLSGDGTIDPDDLSDYIGLFFVGC